MRKIRARDCTRRRSDFFEFCSGTLPEQNPKKSGNATRAVAAPFFSGFFSGKAKKKLEKNGAATRAVGGTLLLGATSLIF